MDDKKLEAALPRGLTMGVSSQGVFLVHGKDKKVHETYPFFRIIKWELPDAENLVLHVRDAKFKTRSTAYKFKSAEAEEIAALMTTISEDIQSVTNKEEL